MMFLLMSRIDRFVFEPLPVLLSVLRFINANHIVNTSLFCVLCFSTVQVPEIAEREAKETSVAAVILLVPLAD